MFQEINNHCLFACAALDDHYHSQHCLKGHYDRHSYSAPWLAAKVILDANIQPDLTIDLVTA
jgi:hypothetical protein